MYDIKYLHVGSDRLIRCDKTIGIFDMDTATVSGVTRTYLTAAQKEKRVSVTSYGLPRSFIVTDDDIVTFSQLSVAALTGRNAELNEAFNAARGARKK